MLTVTSTTAQFLRDLHALTLVPRRNIKPEGILIMLKHVYQCHWVGQPSPVLPGRVVDSDARMAPPPGHLTNISDGASAGGLV